MHRTTIALALLLLAPAVPARQCATGSYAPVNATPWSYVAPPLTGHCLQTYRLFLPDTPPPAEGYPVVIFTDYGAFQAVTDVTLVSNASFPVLLPMLESGIAVVAARLTVSIPDEDVLAWAALGCAPQVIPGDGLFHPPGKVPPDLSVAPYDEASYPMAEKDAVLVVQHVRHLARGTGAGGTPQEQAMALLDHRRIAVWGSSAGSIAFSWPALGPDRRFHAPFLGLGGQYAEATRVDAAILGWNQIWLPMWAPTVSLPYMHWGAGGSSSTPAANIGQADPDELMRNSPLFYERCELNGELPLYTYAIEPSVSTDYVKDYGAACPGTPFCFDDQGAETLLHPTWNQITLAKTYPQTQVAATNAQAEPELIAAGVPYVLVNGVAELGCEIAAWLAAVFAQPADPWTTIALANLGSSQPCVDVGVPGTHGLPVITAGGLLLPGQPWSLQLSNALAGAGGWLVLGTSPVLAPAFGGVLVPDWTTGGIFPFTVDPSGGHAVQTFWPAYPPGSSVYAQFFVADPSAPAGFAATSAVVGISP